MRILLDECVDARVRAAFPGHHVETVPEAGWRALDDAKLLAAAQGRTDVFVTIDKGIEHEQNWRAFSFAVVMVHVARNQIEFYEPLFPELREVVHAVLPGQLVHVGRKALLR